MKSKRMVVLKNCQFRAPAVVTKPRHILVAVLLLILCANNVIINVCGKAMGCNKLSPLYIHNMHNPVFFSTFTTGCLNFGSTSMDGFLDHDYFQPVILYEKINEKGFHFMNRIIFFLFINLHFLNSQQIR